MGYLGFDDIIDERNAAPLVIERQPPGRLWSAASTDTEFELPDGDDLWPEPICADLAAEQPNRIVLFGEKSSLRTVLEPIAQRYGTDLYLPTGDASDSFVYRIAKTGAEDGRPSIVLYLSDADPSGYNMPSVMAWKLAAHRIREFGELQFEVHRAALTPDQVREYDLPDSPLKETEARAGAWVERFGIEQTEVDSLAALQPDLLEQIVLDKMGSFIDLGLAERADAAEEQWKRRAAEGGAWGWSAAKRGVRMRPCTLV